MLPAIFENHYLLAALILAFLVGVPALLLRGRGLRDPSRPERRTQPRSGVDRRA